MYDMFSKTKKHSYILYLGSQKTFLAGFTKACILYLYFKFCHIQYTYGTIRNIHIRTVSSQGLLFTLTIQFNLVYGPFQQSKKDSAFDFCPRTAGKETNVQLYIREAYCPNVYTVVPYVTIEFAELFSPHQNLNHSEKEEHQEKSKL